MPSPLPPLGRSRTRCLTRRLERLEDRLAPAVATWAGGGNANSTTAATSRLSGAVNLNGHRLTVRSFDIVTMSGPIAGTGSLTFEGSQYVLLTGDSTFTGPTTVVGGLGVNGTLPGPVMVAGVPFGGI